MIYERMMKRFMKLDNDMGLPMTLRLYMFLSPECRREVTRLMNEMQSLRGQSPYAMPRDMGPEIMDRVAGLDVSYDYGVSFMKWLFVGVFIWLSIILFSFSDFRNSMGDYFGPHLLIPINIVLGVGISIYAAVYMASHVEEVKKTLNKSFKIFHL